MNCFTKNLIKHIGKTLGILCIAVLCTKLCALILFKTDHSFRENQKYLNGALCCPEILSLIQFVMRGVHYFINQNITLKVVHFGGRAEGLLYNSGQTC